MPICAPRGCGCTLVGSAVHGGSGEPGAPYEIEAGGMTVCTSVTRPGTPFQGQVIFETDTGAVYVYISSTWRLVSHPTGTVRSANAPFCQVSQSSPQSLTSSVPDVLLYDTEVADPYGWHSTSVNTGRVTPNIDGRYQATLVATLSADTDYTRVVVEFRKNGTAYGPAWDGLVSLNSPSPNLTVAGTLVTLDGTTDYIDVSALQINTSAGANTISSILLVELKSRS